MGVGCLSGENVPGRGNSSRRVWGLRQGWGKDHWETEKRDETQAPASSQTPEDLEEQRKGVTRSRA